MATAYICPMCVFNCDNLPDLELHLADHENNVQQSPVKQVKPLASKSVRSSPLYAKPLQPAAVSPLVKSPSALTPTSARSSPNKTYDRRYSCKSCPFSTHSVKTYFNHRQTAHGEQILVTECPYCDYASQYPGKVKKHLTDEHPSQQTPTVDSPLQATRTASRGNSLKMETNVNESAPPVATRFTDCPFCSFTSMDSEEFRKHVLANHLSDKNFRCLVCNRLYRYRGDCSFHIRKKHSDRMIGDNVDSLREYVGEFHPNSMSASELKDLLSCPSAPSLASIPSNSTLSNVRPPPVSVLPAQQPNPAHSFRCGYCKFSSVNSGDVKKHQTWKHANLLSNILPIDPTDPQQQPMMSYKRKRVHSTRPNQHEEDEPSARRQRVSMPSQRQLTIDSVASSLLSTGNGDTESAPRDLLSPNEPGLSFDYDTSTTKGNLSRSTTLPVGSRVYKCVRCERLAPHRWIIERHIRNKHAAEVDDLLNLIVEIDKPSTQGEPMTATKSSADQETSAVPSVKAFSCSECSLQSYHLWVILRHIRNVHQSDGSNAKIIDNINNQIIEDTDDGESDQAAGAASAEMPSTLPIAEDNDSVSENEEMESPKTNVNNEVVLKHLINTAMAARKSHSNGNFLENLPASLMTNNVAASLATLLGQLTNKQVIQQQIQAEKAPMSKRYRCSLCSHVSAWGGNVKKHLKRMHPGEDSGHVIDLGLEGSMLDDQSPSQIPFLSTHHDLKEESTANENSFQQPTGMISSKLKDIDNSPSFAPPSSINNLSQSSRPERLYGCSVCPYECTNSSNIHRHVELHSGDDGGGFQCSQCFFLSKWRASIRKHMISTHGSSLASLTNVLEPLILVKSDEAAVIVKKWLVQENGRKHEEDPNNNHTHSMDSSNYYCSSCPYSNSNRLSFEQHVIHHSLLKAEQMLLTCTFCTFNTDDQETLDDHQMLHITQGDFQQDVTANSLENAIV